MMRHVYFFHKLRKHVGFSNAVSAFMAIRIKKDGVIRFDFLKHPFRIRVGNKADSATFNEVLLRKEYAINPKNPERIIDGGGNIGLTSIFLASRFPDAKIVTVEPSSANFALLKENTAPYANITTMQTAIWSRNAQLRLIDNGFDNSFSVEETDMPAADNFPGTSITDIMLQNGWETIDILKLDIEGGEREIFTHGFEEWLPKTKILIVETHDRSLPGCSKAVFKAVSQYDFSCKLKGFNLIFTNDALVKPVRKPQLAREERK